MPELQLISLASKREPENLMPQADAKNRFFSDEFSNLLRLVFERLRIARPIRKKHAIGLEVEHIFRRHPRRYHRYTRPHLHQPPQNVALDSIIVGDNVAPRFHLRRHWLGWRAGFHRFVPA